MRNTVIHGSAESVLPTMGSMAVDLIFTSPPYYNARPDYAEYLSYKEYLAHLETVFSLCYNVLKEGRFCVVNTSPVLVPREKRSESSIRLAIPFDLHVIMVRLGFDFIDDIVWVKPQGAGVGRNRGFHVHRQPLAYKPTPVTEYVMVYRKHTDKLIDWNIHQYPPDVIDRSLVDKYDPTNVWKIQPAFDKDHPAVFPIELAERVIKYYSYIGDLVLDPYGGSGTTGIAARSLGRDYVLVERSDQYVAHTRKRLAAPVQMTLGIA